MGWTRLLASDMSFHGDGKITRTKNSSDTDVRSFDRTGPKCDTIFLRGAFLIHGKKGKGLGWRQVMGAYIVLHSRILPSYGASPAAVGGLRQRQWHISWSLHVLHWEGKGCMGLVTASLIGSRLRYFSGSDKYA